MKFRQFVFLIFALSLVAMPLFSAEVHSSPVRLSGGRSVHDIFSLLRASGMYVCSHASLPDQYLMSSLQECFKEKKPGLRMMGICPIIFYRDGNIYAYIIAQFYQSSEQCLNCWRFDWTFDGTALVFNHEPELAVDVQTPELVLEAVRNYFRRNCIPELRRVEGGLCDRPPPSPEELRAQFFQLLRPEAAAEADSD